MSGGAMSKVKVESGMAGTVWFGGWLFTIGFLKLSFFKGVLALLVWPYYVGEYFSASVEKIIN